MKCKYCQAELEEGVTLCPACGKEQEVAEETPVVETAEEVEDDCMQIALADAKEVSKKAKVGDMLHVEIKSKEFGRIATQNAKNVILQKIREEERSVIYNQYYEKEKDVVTGDAYGAKAFLFGVGKINGKLMLYHWYYDAASNTYKCSTEPIPVSEQYHFRVEYAYGNGEDVTARYYVNSLLIAESASARVKSGSYGTRLTECMLVGI